MRADILQRLGLGALEAVRNNPTFPYKTGHLKNDATGVTFIKGESFSIYFDKTVAYYIPFLEYGVFPQSYQRMSKNGTMSWVTTRGSTKHVGFISERAVADIINYLARALHKRVNYAIYNTDGSRVGGIFND